MRQITDDWLLRGETQSMFEVIEDAGHQALAVGGCVRDSLLGRETNDIDIATDAHPDRIIQIAGRNGFDAIPTGYAHGTVTIVVNGYPFEVTTFRRDVESDGRRATIAFSDNIEDDARRRDFTMNALYADREGRVADPIGGMPDLLARRIRFIEDPSRRIREDYLRSLRFFRFHAWYGDPANGFDPEAVAAIAANLEGLNSLSRERIGAEMLKLLAAPDPAPSVGGMQATGVLATACPGADCRPLAPLIHLEQEHSVKPDPLRRLAAMGGSSPREHLRLSRKQFERLEATILAAGMSAEEAGYRFGAQVAQDALLVIAATLGTPVQHGALDAASAAASRNFPISASDLLPDFQGAVLGQTLKKLEQRWIDSKFNMTRDELLAQVSKGG